MLELREVIKYFNKFKVLDKISFILNPGDILGYLGPNGAGKTTTLKILAGLLEPSNGTVLYQGHNILKNLMEYKKKVGYVPEEPFIYPYLSAYDYLMMIGRLRGFNDFVLKQKIKDLMEIFDLGGDMYSEMATYSKGMIQKVLLLAALLHDPEVLLLDEPLSGLDVASIHVVREIIRRLAREGKIIIYSSHHLEIVEKIARRIIIIHQGRIWADESINNLRQIMNAPSLEDVFRQLITPFNPEQRANELISVIKKAL